MANGQRITVCFRTAMVLTISAILAVDAGCGCGMPAEADSSTYSHIPNRRIASNDHCWSYFS